MDVNLRFGMQRDKEIIRDLADKINGLVIPAHILAYQAAPTSVFVASFKNMPYIIDPMTFLLQHSREDLVNDSDELRKSIDKMCNEYHPSLSDLLSNLSAGSRLNLGSIPNQQELCENIYKTQIGSVADKSVTKKAEKYIKRYGRGMATLPRLVVSPYFYFNSTDDPWYGLSLELSRTMKNVCDANSESLEVGVILFLSADKINDGMIQQISSDYASFKHILVWFDDFNESGVSSNSIINARKLIKRLADFSCVEVLYGGYLLMTSAYEGLSAISHGILYSLNKSFAITPGVGGVPERYYIPKFKAFRSLSQTDLILHRHTELICDCEICQDVMQGNPDRIVLFADEPERLRQHFITVRRNEADCIGNTDRDNIVVELRDTYQTYHESISLLPNPDAVVSRSNMSGLEYLNRWADGIEPNIR